MVVLELFHAFIIFITLLKDNIYNILYISIMKMVMRAPGYLRSTYTHKQINFFHALVIFIQQQLREYLLHIYFDHGYGDW